LLRTLGIAYSHTTGRATCCAIQWVSQLALVELPKLGMLDPVLLDEMDRADWTAVTGAPFGWPDDLLDAIAGFAQTGRWPTRAPADRMRHRETDRFVRDLLRDEHGVTIEPPAATSRDSAIATWLVAQLLTAHADRTGRSLDRIGVPCPTGMDGPPDLPRGLVEFPPCGVIETHVPAALAAWGLPHDRYVATTPAEHHDARARRAAILDQLEQGADAWLMITDDVRRMCTSCDDALEALVGAIVACAVATDTTIRPTVEQRGKGQREGWLHIPIAGSLARLAPGFA
jgi:hypothetical protein